MSEGRFSGESRAPASLRLRRLEGVADLVVPVGSGLPQAVA